MRIALTALALLAGCSSGAQAACQYDLYIYQPVSGPEVYAVAGEGRAAAVEVRGCGEATLLPDATAWVGRLEARRQQGDLNVVTIEGRGSRTYLGSCSSAEDDKDDEEGSGRDEDNLVFIDDASAAQMRRTLLTLGAAPREVREQLIDSLALRACAATRR